MSSSNYQNEPAAAAAAGVESLQQQQVNAPPVAPSHPKMVHSHLGEHHGSFGGDPDHIKITKSTYIYVLCAALNSCNLGYDIGVNTQAGPLLQDSMGLTDSELEIFFGSLNLFSIAGAASANFISDRFGRRKSFIVASAFFVVGVVILTIAQNFATLMTGRLFIGLGVGFGLAIDPLYISELSPAAHRGELVTWSELAVNVGIILGFASGFIFGPVDDDIEWRLMFAMGGILPLVMIYLAKCVMPESPRWLVSKGETDDAKQVMEKVYPAGYNVDPVIQDMQDSIAREVAASKHVGWDEIFYPTPAVKRMLIAGVGTAMAQQAVGIDAIQYFLLFILDESGMESRYAKTGALMFLGFVKLVFIIISSKLLDRKGRRPMFFVSLGGMTVALWIVACAFIGTNKSGLAIFGLALYLASFSIGMGPGAWLVPAEVFSTCIRAKAMSIASTMNRCVATLMSSTCLSTANAISWQGFFFMLSIICIIVAVFIYFFLPETMGRSLEDMAVYFAEITGDERILEAEALIVREREARRAQVQVTEGVAASPVTPEATLT